MNHLSLFDYLEICHFYEVEYIHFFIDRNKESMYRLPREQKG